MILTIAPIMLAASGAAAPGNPLPEQRDIPDGFSAVVCDNQAKATKMLTYYQVKPAPKNFGTDTKAFFAGLKATGCKQKSSLRNESGDIAIDQVVKRVTLRFKRGPNRFIQFVGRWPDGRVVHGIVDEDWNNRMPRTPLAKWMDQRSEDGWLDTRLSEHGGFSGHFYRCKTAKQARGAVRLIKKREAIDDSAFDRNVTSIAKNAGCRRAADKYFVTAKFENADFDCGHECYVDITALEAIDQSGQRVGLIFDASPF